MFRVLEGANSFRVIIFPQTPFNRPLHANREEREREKELPSSHGVKWYVPVSNGGPTIRGQIRRDETMGYNGTMGLTLCFLSLLTSATERQEETNASGTLIVLTCRFGLFESAGVVAFRNSLYGPRYGHVSRRYGAVAIPWPSRGYRLVRGGIESVNEINARVAISWLS